MSTTVSNSTTSESNVVATAKRAREAARLLSRLSNDDRNRALIALADAIEKNASRILEANREDCRIAEAEMKSGKMSAAMFKRLQVSERGVQEMADRVRDVARLADPLNRRLSGTELDEGLVLYKETCPLGVVGIIFEARPEVIPQVGSLALKSGNAVIMKGGAEAARSNESLISIWRDCLANFPEIPVDSIALLHSRADVNELLAQDEYVDLIIPRGSKDLVDFISRNSRIPVLGHGEGVCHVYVDRAADLEKAINVAFDSKTQYPAVCNAAETLLVHQDIAAMFLPRIVEKLQSAKVEIRGCAQTLAAIPNKNLIPATEEDWATEYSDLILSVKIVSSLDEAIAHISRYGTRHTESIVTEDAEAARIFMNEVDAASVFQNASTRFADGFRYGLGAEIGISNSKLHARGPMGMDGLTTYKYKLFGNGQTVAEYASGARQFHHRAIQ